MFGTNEWTLEKRRFIGGSLAGVGTSIGALDFGVCFDLGNGPRHTLRFNDFFITHAHSDHAGGLAYVASQKAMHNQKNFRYYVPAETASSLQRIIEEWQKLEDFILPCQLRGLEPGEEIELSPQLKMKAFRTVHRVPSLGYTLISRKKKLKKELMGLSGAEIVARRRRGEETEEWIETPELTFTGDTQIEVLERHPELLESKILFYEVTFYDDRKPVAEARKWGHTHFEEILPFLPSFKGNRLVLMHHSARYRRREIMDLVKSRASEHFERLFIAPSLYS